MGRVGRIESNRAQWVSQVLPRCRPLGTSRRTHNTGSISARHEDVIQFRTSCEVWSWHNMLHVEDLRYPQDNRQGKCSLLPKLRPHSRWNARNTPPPPNTWSINPNSKRTNKNTASEIEICQPKTLFINVISYGWVLILFSTFLPSVASLRAAIKI